MLILAPGLPGSADWELRNGEWVKPHLLLCVCSVQNPPALPGSRPPNLAPPFLSPGLPLSRFPSGPAH